MNYGLSSNCNMQLRGWCFIMANSGFKQNRGDGFVSPFLSLRFPIILAGWTGTWSKAHAPGIYSDRGSVGQVDANCSGGSSLSSGVSSGLGDSTSSGIKVGSSVNFSICLVSGWSGILFPTGTGLSTRLSAL